MWGYGSLFFFFIFLWTLVQAQTTALPDVVAEVRIQLSFSFGTNRILSNKTTTTQAPTANNNNESIHTIRNFEGFRSWEHSPLFPAPGKRDHLLDPFSFTFLIPFPLAKSIVAETWGHKKNLHPLIATTVKKINEPACCVCCSCLDPCCHCYPS